MVAQADLWRQLENMARDKKNVPKKKETNKGAPSRGNGPANCGPKNLATSQQIMAYNNNSKGLEGSARTRTHRCVLRESCQERPNNKN